MKFVSSPECFGRRVPAHWYQKSRISTSVPKMFLFLSFIFWRNLKSDAVALLRLELADKVVLELEEAVERSSGKNGCAFHALISTIFDKCEAKQTETHRNPKTNPTQFATKELALPRTFCNCKSPERNMNSQENYYFPTAKMYSSAAST